MRHASMGAVFSSHTSWLVGEKSTGGASVTVCAPPGASMTLFVKPLGTLFTITRRRSSNSTFRYSMAPLLLIADASLIVVVAHDHPAAPVGTRADPVAFVDVARSEERRVGKECRSR